MAEPFLQILIENLSSLIEKEIGLMMGVDKEMKKLQSTLTTIQSVLEDVDGKQLQNKPIQNWLRKLKNAAYEIEDISDECTTEVSKQERKGRRFNLRKVLFSHKIGRRMKIMTERLDALATERHNFHLHETVVPQSREADCRRETGSILIEPDHVYGREEDKEKIVDILVDQVSDCEQLSVIPIIGVGGLGKTTLAQSVFNDQRVSQHFDNKLWVSVSDNFDLKILLEAMIVSATGNGSNVVQLDALQRRVWDLLDQKRYLLILDDVWNENQEDWVKLKSILMCGSKGASIVVTTRLRKVADVMGTLPTHSLKGLSEEDLWSLFKLRALGHESEVHPNLEAIGRQIIKKCMGVPLMAKALGGLLRFKRTEKDWIHVKESEIWDLPEEETMILPALRLSYYHLPMELRQCFAYCAIFPKDSEMEKQDLIFHWIGHGCISSHGVEEVEDVGEQVWKEFVLRSFFQEVHTIGTWTFFKMHDLVHDLAQSIMENKVAGNDTNNKVREVYFNRLSYDSSCSGISAEVLRLTTIMNYTRVRILKLKWARVEKLPSDIGKLKHLRFLDLTGSSISTLPRTFCSLWNLKILILNKCHHLERLPKHIRYMTNLRHIFLVGCFKLREMPSGIGELTSLRTLSVFIVGHKVDNQVDQLELLDLGGSIEIMHLERTKNHMYAKKANLVRKSSLRSLVLSWAGDRASEESAKLRDEKVMEALEPHPNLENLEISGFRGSYFPLWITKMKNLTHLSIENCQNCSHIPLGDLPCLKSLYIWNLGGLEHIVDQSQNSVGAKIFPSLEKLRLVALPKLKELVMEKVEGEIITFPNLRELYIEECELLRIPVALTNLERLTAWKCSQMTVCSISKAKLEKLHFLELDFGKIETTTSCSQEDAWEGLSNLMELRVWQTREQDLPEKWFQGLKSLRKLDIWKCRIGRRIPKGWLRHLSALEDLQICDCPELVELEEEIKELHLLKHLTLQNLPHMVSLPQELQHLSSLQSLRLINLPQLSSLPAWMGDLTSLANLEIHLCPMLTSLPSTIQGLPNLKFCKILCCPQLERHHVHVQEREGLRIGMRIKIAHIHHMLYTAQVLLADLLFLIVLVVILLFCF